MDRRRWWISFRHLLVDEKDDMGWADFERFLDFLWFQVTDETVHESFLRANLRSAFASPHKHLSF